MSAPKRERMRLAKAELLAHLASTAEGWRADLLHERPAWCSPPEEWPAEEPLVTLARTYDLSFPDLARICDALGDELEARAIRAGYDDHWDEVPA